MGAPRIVAVIPARYASQRLPAKPLFNLGGKPMVQRVYERVSEASHVSRVLVATDDERIAQVVRSFGGDVVLTSPTIASGSDRVAVVAEMVDADIFVNVQGDEPLIPPAMIEQCVELLIEDERAQVGTLVRRIEVVDDLWNPNIVKVVFDQEMTALYFSRSPIPYLREIADKQQWLFHHTFYKHIGMYVYRKDFLRTYSKLQKSTLEHAEKLEQLRILEHGYRIKIGITQFDSIAVDTYDDAERVERILQQSV